MNLLRNKHGFTFIELSVVMAILSVLSAIALTYFNDVFARGRDSAAVSDAISLITVVNNHFLDKKSVNYEAISADGRNFGIEDEVGNPIPAVFSLSAGVRIKFESTAGARPAPYTASSNFSPSDEETKGNFTAFIYHFQGTPDPTNSSGAGVFRRCVQVIIDENTGVHWHGLY